MISKAQLFHTVHGVLKARILKWFAIPFMRNAGLDEAQAGIKMKDREAWRAVVHGVTKSQTQLSN